uniref:Serine/threonine-protein kinase RIO1 n=2 Tax=Rhizochromulina marina TaxID=1034831 RepID=A0A7S2S657_9STRA|mmetsp:Transcript_25681/g.74950  ORF Transcript_25681/g.74950 Transcript_25681/m.74950 type:complete len:475 (+) Transcript_25681:3-1427(+)
MDPRTRLMLFKLLNSQFLAGIDGCVSTGKEANVYYAKAGERGLQAVASQGFQEFAVKVFKTSILVFKDRDKYVSGEYRFRNGYCKSNPRKMVKTWAEKEMRNLRRLYAAGIPSPEPVLLKNHILVMQFIGKDGWPAPRLKDAQLSERRLRESYWQVVRHMRKLFHTCKLVHGDLSEYNMLYFEGEVYIIDVSQSVEHDHPHASELLRKDCFNVNAFFAKAGLQPMSTRMLYDFVVDEHIHEDEDEEARLIEIQSLVAEDSDPAERAHDDAVFMGMFIPRSLTEVANVEDDARHLTSGNREEAYAQRVAGLLGETTPRRRSKPHSEGHAREPGDRQRAQPEEDEAEDHDCVRGAHTRMRPVTLEALAQTPVSQGHCDESEGSDSPSGEEDEEDDEVDEEDARGGGGRRGRKNRDGEDGIAEDCSGRLPADEEARKAAKAAKKLAAQRAKEDRREKRKEKVKKHIKKQKTKAGKKH